MLLSILFLVKTLLQPACHRAVGDVHFIETADAQSPSHILRQIRKELSSLDLKKPLRSALEIHLAVHAEASLRGIE